MKPPGLRTQKVVNGVKHEYYYVDGLLVYENIGDENLMYYRYDQNGTVIAINRIRLSDGATGLLYPVTNSRGDVVELRNGSGVLNAKYTYDSWGKLISITDANGNPVSEDSLAMFNSIRYRGYVYDRETGLYYLQSRYYDPETGRFLNADAVDYFGASGTMLGYNAFAYCENNPVNDSDPSGSISRTNLSWLLDIVLTLVAPYFSGPLDVFGRIISAYAKRKNFKLIWDKLLYGAVPKFRGLFSKFFTTIRTAIWRATGSFISNSYTSLIGRFIESVRITLKSKVWRNAIDIISCFFSAGSIVAGFLDWADGSFNGTVNFRRSR